MTSPFSLVRQVLESGHIAAKIMRFGMIGVLSGTIYAVVTTLLVRGCDMAPVPASALGYCASVPASFLGHRSFSFRSGGRWTAEALRFICGQALNIAVTMGAMQAAVRWAGAWWLGMVAAVILVPIANFVFMNLWVFRDQQGRIGKSS